MDFQNWPPVGELRCVLSVRSCFSRLPGLTMCRSWPPGSAIKAGPAGEVSAISQIHIEKPRFKREYIYICDLWWFIDMEKLGFSREYDNMNLQTWWLFQQSSWCENGADKSCGYSATHRISWSPTWGYSSAVKTMSVQPWGDPLDIPKSTKVHQNPPKSSISGVDSNGKFETWKTILHSWPSIDLVGGNPTLLVGEYHPKKHQSGETEVLNPYKSLVFWMFLSPQDESTLGPPRWPSSRVQSARSPTGAHQRWPRRARLPQWPEVARAPCARWHCADRQSGGFSRWLRKTGGGEAQTSG